MAEHCTVERKHCVLLPNIQTINKNGSRYITTTESISPHPVVAVTHACGILEDLQSFGAICGLGFDRVNPQRRRTRCHGVLRCRARALLVVRC